VAAQKLAGAHPMSAEAWAPSGRDDEKGETPVAAQ
jgi:hypothetical protein